MISQLTFYCLIVSFRESHFQFWVDSMGIKGSLGTSVMKECLSPAFAPIYCSFCAVSQGCWAGSCPEKQFSAFSTEASLLLTFILILLHTHPRVPVYCSPYCLEICGVRGRGIILQQKITPYSLSSHMFLTAFEESIFLLCPPCITWKRGPAQMWYGEEVLSRSNELSGRCEATVARTVRRWGSRSEGAGGSSRQHRSVTAKRCAARLRPTGAQLAPRDDASCPERTVCSPTWRAACWAFFSRRGTRLLLPTGVGWLQVVLPPRAAGGSRTLR